MKGKIKNVFHKFCFVHSTIGKVLTSFLLCFAIVALIGVPLGITKCHNQDEVVVTNHFLYEEVSLHENNYKITVNSAENTKEALLYDKDNIESKEEGSFVKVNITLTQVENSNLDPHKLDTNDFKIKDHTGVIVPFSDIGTLVGWDMIDVHYDKKDGGNVISSAEFFTTSAVKSYEYYHKEISKDNPLNFNIYFKLNSKYQIGKEIIVLEIDFYTGKNDYKIGEDIILLPNPFINK